MRLAPVSRSRSFGRAGAAAALAIVLAACGTGRGVPPSSSPRTSDQVNALVGAARGELELTLSWASGFLDSAQEIRRDTEGFNRLYGLNLRVTFKPTDSMHAGSARAIQEFQHGTKSSTDVILGTEAEISDLANAGVLVTEPWATWAPNIANPRLVAAGGVAVKVQTRMPGITYNIGKLSGGDVPHSLGDLLKPQYKGRVATTATPATLERLGGSELWGIDRTMSYVRKLAPQVGGFVDCGDEDRIANGEFDVFVFDCGSARVAQLKAKGTLIGWSEPSDASLLGYLYMGVPKNAAHPNAAKLWINYMLGREAQDAMYEYDFADYHLLPGSRTFSEVDRATKSGVKFYELTVEMVLVDTAKGIRPIGPELQAMLRDAVAARK